MQRTLAKYGTGIQSGQINPLINWDGRQSGILFDPTDEATPLETMTFGAYRLENGPFTIETGQDEYALVPVDGAFEVTVGRQTFSGRREGGPFASLPEASNASCVYVPAGEAFTLSGAGEMVLFAAPARASKPAVYVAQGDRPNLRRGTATWHRDVITLFTPQDITTNLVGGETYSPPSLWSGTPLHVHDKDDSGSGQSDHEEVYYHLARVTDGDWGAYGVQMLFDNEGLDKAYRIGNRSAFAIPGAAHPVVAGPMSDMLYVWALAGPSDELAMMDVPEFAYLKEAQEIIDRFDAQRGLSRIARADFDQAADAKGLSVEQRKIVELHLRERGYDIG
ncbi:MAG: 5-deoxy-glucuronate isomerase [Phycisphaerae bacterium]|nr:5-deoxy-glucuronate isomerase [Phycisphaerae bacterium]